MFGSLIGGLKEAITKIARQTLVSANPENGDTLSNEDTQFEFNHSQPDWTIRREA